MKTLARFVVFAVALQTAQGQAPSGARVTERRLYTVMGQERWLYPGQRPATVRWSDIDLILGSLDSLASNGGRGDTFRSTRPAAGASIRVAIWRGVSGSLDSITSITDTLIFVGRGGASPATEAASHDRFLFDPVANMIDLFPMYLGAPPSSARPIPVRLTTRTAMHALTISGTVISRAVGDTLVHGRPLVLVRDSISVEMSSISAKYVYPLRADERSERRVRGTLLVRRVYDASEGISRYATDSLKMSGTEFRRVSNERTRSTPVRFERTRAIALIDAPTVAEYQAQRMQRLGMGVGMIQRPNSDVPQLDVRKPDVVDSLVSRHARAQSQAERDSIERLHLPGLAFGLRERFARTYATEGDTARALQTMRLSMIDTLTPWVYQLLRPYLDNPQLAMRYGFETHSIVADLGYHMTRYSGIWTGAREGSTWCAAEACRMLSAEWERAREPRLRSVGLITRAVLDPSRWGDTVIRRAAAGDRHLESFSAYLRGVRPPNAGEPPIEMPSASADYREWLVWLRGATDATLARRDSINRARGTYDSVRIRQNGGPVNVVEYRSTLRIVSIDGMSTQLKRIAQRRQLSYVDSLLARRATAPNDTARFVYDVLLREFGAPVRSADVLIEAFRSPSALDREMARRETERLPFAVADSATAHDIEDTLLAHLLDGAPYWARFDAVNSRASSPIAQIRASDSAHVVADSLTASSRARLARAGIPVHSASWNLPAASSGRVFKMSAVYRAGAFARVTVSDTRLVRLANGRGGGNASGSTLILVLIDGEWKLLDGSWWVT